MISLHPTISADLDFVLAAEADPQNGQYITQWQWQQHEQALTDSECAHRIIRATSDGARVGFLMLWGLQSPHRCVEFRRIVVERKGCGLGRAALRAGITLGFTAGAAHRVWLDVKSHNARARALYRSEGLVEEGLLRECLIAPDGRFESMVLMSMLRPEFEARLAGDGR
jgi:RimJ/RimL family protein N-acetyltransferase